MLEDAEVTGVVSQVEVVLGLVVAPKPTRLVASVLAVSGASDQLHHLRAIVTKASA